MNAEEEIHTTQQATGKDRKPEIKALCELFDAYRSNCDDSLESMGKRLEALGNKLTRYESE